MIHEKYPSLLSLIMTLRIIIGVLAGGVLGFSYYKFIGCSSGTCPLTSNPYISTIYGIILGAVISANIH